MSNTRTRTAQISEEVLDCEIHRGVIALGDQSLAEASKLLKIWGMTVLQYDALRVLYVLDANDEGLPSGEIGKNVYTRVPDVTRLLDRLEDKGWIARERDEKNRRVVRVRLTGLGIELVESAYLPLRELEAQQLERLTQDEKQELQSLLNKALNP